MTYDEIMAKLMEHAPATAMAFSLAVREEARALMGDRKQTHGAHATRALKAAQHDAQDFYAEDISVILAAPSAPLTPDDVLGLRRKPTAWAVATILRGVL